MRGLMTTVTAFDESERLIWAGQAGAYAGSFARLCAFPVEWLLDAAEVRLGTHVLDVGTGTGTAAAAACGRGAKVTAVDAEPSMVEMAALNISTADVQVAALPSLPFRDDEFDAVVANFVLNHVGQPLPALAELRRVTRPGGRIALTIWSVPAAAGQALLGRAIQAVGVTRPAHLPPLSLENDFPHTKQGFAALLDKAGFAEVSCQTLNWDHRTTPAEWWSGAVAGVGFTGHVVASQPPELIAEIKRHFDLLSTEFTGPDGSLWLPHTALLAFGKV